MSKPTQFTMSVAAVLAACHPPTYVTRVTRKHKLSGDWRARAFTIMPGSGNGGQEFGHFADTVASHLRRHGLVPADGAPDVVVTLRYGARSLMLPRPSNGTPMFSRWAEVVMHDAQSPKAMLFHGRAVSDGANRNLLEVLPHVIAGLFRDFPGPGQETLTLHLPGVMQSVGAEA
jgi:hypothetical protein